MTARVLDAMMTVVKWAERDKICDEFRGIRCIECPYYVIKGVCDKKSTKWVLHYAARVFQKYFEEVSCKRIR